MATRYMVILSLWLTLATIAARGALYEAGDIVQNFTLTNRETRQPTQLTDFAGKIIFLDWFAWWCPFCQAAAPQLLDGIDHWYDERNGNPAGIPVVHIGVNLQSGQEPQTQQFVDRAQLEIVLEDFNRAVASKFATGGQPIFAIINGVANSPSHRQWELLYVQQGYGQTQFPVGTFREAIDSVQASVIAEPPSPVTLMEPMRAADQAFEFKFNALTNRNYRIEYSSDLRNWTTATNLLSASTQVVFRDAQWAPTRRYYRVISE